MLYEDKYKTQSARLAGYDYSNEGLYFVTICTKNREGYFGEIVNDEMKLSEIGKIVDKFWLKITDHFPFANLDIYQIMPNHLHGIIEIIKNTPLGVETTNLGVSKNHQAFGLHKTPGSGVSTETNWKPGCLGVIINQYKRICTMEIKKQLNPITFSWQSRYYDRIIRNEKELNRIREYILKNPINWEKDRNNIENIFY